MKTVGETLRAAREKKGIDTTVVSDTLKIREKYILALENGDYSVFDSSLYLKGFLTNYCKLLGLDENEILALYRRENIQEVPQPSPHLNIPKYKKTSLKSIKFTLKPGYIVGLVVALAVITIVVYLVFQFKTFSTPPSLKITAPISDVQEVNSSSITISGKTDVGNTVTVNGDVVSLISSDGSFSEEFSLRAGVNSFTIVASNSLGRTSTVTKTVNFNSKSINPASGSSDGIHAKLVSTANSVWVKVFIDGDFVPVFEGILNNNETKEFSAKKEMKISSGDGAHTNLTVNDKTIILQSGYVEKDITIKSLGEVDI